jgi:hypothetical protein
VLTAFGVCNQRSNLKYDEALSISAFNFNLRRYSEAHATSARVAGQTAGAIAAAAAAGRARCCPKVIQRMLHRRFLSQMTSCDVASNICLTLYGGGGGAGGERARGGGAGGSGRGRPLHLYPVTSTLIADSAWI